MNYLFKAYPQSFEIIVSTIDEINSEGIIHRVELHGKRHRIDYNMPVEIIVMSTNERIYLTLADFLAKYPRRECRETAS